MVRIRHPNLFVDKSDGYMKILLVHSEKKDSACRNLFFNIFVHLRKIYRFSLPIFRRIFTFGANFSHRNCKFVGFDIIFSEFW